MLEDDPFLSLWELIRWRTYGSPDETGNEWWNRLSPPADGTALPADLDQPEPAHVCEEADETIFDTTIKDILAKGSAGKLEVYGVPPTGGGLALIPTTALAPGHAIIDVLGATGEAELQRLSKKGDDYGEVIWRRLCLRRENVLAVWPALSPKASVTEPPVVETVVDQPGLAAIPCMFDGLYEAPSETGEPPRIRNTRWEGMMVAALRSDGKATTKEVAHMIARCECVKYGTVEKVLTKIGRPKLLEMARRGPRATRA